MTVRHYSLPLLLLSSATPTHAKHSCPLSRVQLRDGQSMWTGLPAPMPLDTAAVNCTWYRDSTCCSAEDTLRISHQVPEVSLGQSSRGCRDVLHMLMCSPCSPHQSELFVSERVGEFTMPVMRVCESVCHHMYSKCASALYGSNGGRRVDLLFSDGLQLCNAVGLRVVREQDHAICFSAAPPRRRRLGAWTALAVAFGTMLACGRTWLVRA